MPIRVVSEETLDELYIKAAPLVVDAISACCERQGQCIIGFMGGRSALPLLDRMLPYARQIGGRLHIFWIDERLEAAEKNYAPALPLLEQMSKMGVHIETYPLRATQRDSIRAEIHQVLERFAQLKREPGFDIVVASAGEDGHVASIFPHSSTLHITDSGYALVENAPKPPPVRVTVTPPLLLSAQEAFLFFVGKKRQAYEAFMRAAPVEQCPCRLLAGIPSVTVLASLE